MTPAQKKIIEVSATVASAREQLLGKMTGRGTVIGLETFTYNADFLAASVAAGATQQTTTDIQADSDFLVLFMLAWGAGPTLNNSLLLNNIAATLQVGDNTTNRTFFSQPMMISNVCGNGGTPYIMPESKLIYARTRLTTVISNLRTDGQANFYQIGFSGLKVFYKGEPGQGV
ncbi:MAG: hypothetical protein V4563_17250 [Pseudomonadota bacterium]